MSQISCQRVESAGWFRDRGLPDLELEVFGVEQPASALADHADGDIAGLDACRGEWVLGVVADALCMAPEQAGEALQWREVRLLGKLAPLRQPLGHVTDVDWPLPQVLELLLQGVDSGEVFIRGQQLGESILLGIAESLGVLEQQVAAACQQLLVGRVGAAEFGAPHLVDDLGVVLHDVKAIEDDRGLGKGLAHRVFEGRAHVDGHGLDAIGDIAIKPVEEVHQCGLGAPLGNPQQVTGHQVVDERDVVMALGASDFVHAQVTQARQRTGVQGRKLGAKSALIHGFDRAPGQAGIAGHRRDAHVPAQLTDEATEPVGHAHAGVHERQVLDPTLRGTHLDLAVLDFQPDLVPPQRQIADPPTQPPVHRPPLPGDMISRHEAPIPSARHDQRLRRRLPPRCLDALTRQTKNLRRDDRTHIQAPSFRA